MRPVALIGALLIAGCGLAPMPRPAAPVDDAGPRISFAVPETWTRLPQSGDAHYFTSGDPQACANVVGDCDPTTFVMAPDTIDVAITPVADDTGCAEVSRPTWEARVEARAATIRDATNRITWSVCYPGSADAVQIAADLRAGAPEARDELLAQLREFIASVVLIQAGGEFAPEK